MNNCFKVLLVFLCLVSVKSLAHDGISGRVVSALDEQPLVSALVVVTETMDSMHTDWNGAFAFVEVKKGTYHLKIVMTGYVAKDLVVKAGYNDRSELRIVLEETILELEEILVTSEKDFTTTTFNALNLKLRPLNSSQDFLKMVPGLFVAQHAGGGKAEQIFLRGFDVDHGTDIAISVDGIPVNMVSHAHGQGYSDLHFIIPETVDKINVSLGPYRGDVGDFMTAGTIGLKTFRSLDKNIIKIEGGKFNYLRGLTMVNLLKKTNQTIYVASEYNFMNGYFDAPQKFDRFNLFGKYNGSLSKKINLEFSAASFYSDWDASGQVPERSVNSNQISRFGSIDPTEGGKTSRQTLNLLMTYDLSERAEFKSQLFYSHYDFTLFSNFTFYLRDSINGDQIKQSEDRNLLGYNLSYTNRGTLLGKKIKTTLGLGARYDNIKNSELSSTVKRAFLNNIMKGAIVETNLNAFIEETIYLSSTLTLNAALRYDHFIFLYNNQLSDTSYSSVQKGIVSPKVNLYYTPSTKVQFFIKAGTGFHSNDTRVVVVQRAGNVLPRAIGTDVGSSSKLFKNMILTTTIWGLYLQNEFVYVGDEGVVEVSGKTFRKGIDISLRYQLWKWLYADADLNLTSPRSIDEVKGNNYVPLAPVLCSVGGMMVKFENGLSGSIRYRYLGNRPANEDYSIVAKGYFINDVVLRYATKHYEAMFSVENIFNIRWKETQFDTTSKLKNEQQPVSEIHYTPGTPLFLKMGMSYLF